MNDLSFCKSFAFCAFQFTRNRHTDKSCGTICHHIGRLTAGRAEFVTDGEKICFEAGDVFFIPCGCRYHSYWYGEDKIAFESYAFTYTPDAGETRYTLQKLNLTPQAQRCIEELSADRRVTPKSVGLLYQFLGEVQPAMTAAGKDAKSALVERAKRYILAHPDFTVPQLAMHCRVSESRLYAIFREVTGHTPVGEKHRVLADRAAALLQTTDLSVEEIGERLGFGTAAYFRKVLRAVYGMTPREIRKGRHDEL